MRKNSIESNNEYQIRWWWPGNWLRIVYSVWFDQLWYWENIRPLLTNNSKRQRPILLQAMLGALMTIPIPFFMLRIVFRMFDLQFNWERFNLGFLLGAIVGILLGFTISARRGNWGNLPICATASTSFGATLGFVLGKPPTEEFYSVVLFLFPLILAFFIVFPLILAAIVINGRRMDTKGKLIKDSAMFVLILIVLNTIIEDIVFAILTSVAAGLGYYLTIQVSNLWATRQVADDTLRLRLANPDKDV